MVSAESSVGASSLMALERMDMILGSYSEESLLSELMLMGGGMVGGCVARRRRWDEDGGAEAIGNGGALLDVDGRVRMGVKEGNGFV